MTPLGYDLIEHHVESVINGAAGRFGGKSNRYHDWVTLLTAASSRLGVWVGRTRQHALLVGLGTPRPRLQFLEKDPGVRPGDVVSTSPASTLLPPNIPVGVVQSVNEQAVPAPDGLVQLSAPVDAVDWVQVRTR